MHPRTVRRAAAPALALGTAAGTAGPVDDPAFADPWPAGHPARATRRDVVAAPVTAAVAGALASGADTPRGAPAVVALALAALMGTALLRRAGDRRHHRDFDREPA